ncbi:hypothetical protein SHVI106290_09960 [Shewanella violacea]
MLLKAFQIEGLLFNAQQDELQGIKADKSAEDFEVQFDDFWDSQELSYELNHDHSTFILTENKHADLAANRPWTSWLLVTAGVIICHLALVFTLDLLWIPAPQLYPEAKIKGIQSQGPQLKVPRLKAYMYFKAPVIEKSKSEIIDKQIQQAKPLVSDLPANDLQIKEATAQGYQVKPAKEKEKRESDTRPLKKILVQETLIQESLVHETLVQNTVVKQLKQPPVKQADVSNPETAYPQSKSANFFSSEPESNDERDKLIISNFSSSTQKYLSRQREEALGELVVKQANQYSQTKTLSEMDGEMIILKLPKVDTWSNAQSLDNGLDPNRIVKQGDTCYRIVQTPTQIDPHAESLGYAFRCDGDSLVAALKRAIAKRVHKTPIKR